MPRMQYTHAMTPSSMTKERRPSLGDCGRKLPSRLPSVLLLLLFVLPLSLCLVSCKGSLGKEESLPVKLERTLSQTSELGVVQYKLRKVVKANDDQWYKLGERKILYSCAAYIKAGVDLREFSPQDVELTPEGKVIVTMPHAKVLSVDIPLDEIVLAYEQVTLLRAPFSAEERNTILKEGERQIREDIPSLGILSSAESQASKFFEILLHDMGYKDVEVIFRDSKMKGEGN